ncbi:MAG: 50S ribosomal protein L27 [Anaerolineae bacterium]|nr:50S ribosomal protein L27 [Anaerolineae bacterium]
MAHKKGSGSAKNGRDSISKRRGIKKFGGEYVIPGSILIRQCGTKMHPGTNVGMGKDFTIFSTIEGYVKYEYMPQGHGRKQVSVYSERE